MTIEELQRLRISISDFEVKKTIGRGHFGEVHVVREKQMGDVYALKVLRKADMLAQQNVCTHLFKFRIDYIVQTLYSYFSQISTIQLVHVSCNQDM